MVADDPSTADEYGHGTHVAGIIAGRAHVDHEPLPERHRARRPARSTSACSATTASGFTSDVIAGIDWAIANRRALQHPRHQPVARPPGDGAGRHRSAVRRGAARGQRRHRRGRRGRQRRPDAPTACAILGGITSPGNSPYAITVGAIDTKGTTSRSDDAVAPYSSRGPTKFDRRGQAGPGRARQRASCRSRRRLVSAAARIRCCIAPASATTPTCT